MQIAGQTGLPWAAAQYVSEDSDPVGRAREASCPSRMGAHFSPRQCAALVMKDFTSPFASTCVLRRPCRRLILHRIGLPDTPGVAPGNLGNNVYLGGATDFKREIHCRSERANASPCIGGRRGKSPPLSASSVASKRPQKSPTQDRESQSPGRWPPPLWAWGPSVGCLLYAGTMRICVSDRNVRAHPLVEPGMHRLTGRCARGKLWGTRGVRRAASGHWTPNCWSIPICAAPVAWISQEQKPLRAYLKDLAESLTAIRKSVGSSGNSEQCQHLVEGITGPPPVHPECWTQHYEAVGCVRPRQCQPDPYGCRCEDS